MSRALPVTVQLYVANIPLSVVVAALGAHMAGGTAWEGQGFDQSGPVEPSVILRGTVTNLLAFREQTQALLHSKGEKTAFTEVWDAASGRYYGPMVWEARPILRAVKSA